MRSPFDPSSPLNEVEYFAPFVGRYFNAHWSIRTATQLGHLTGYGGTRSLPSVSPGSTGTAGDDAHPWKNTAIGDGLITQGFCTSDNWTDGILYTVPSTATIFPNARENDGTPLATPLGFVTAQGKLWSYPAPGYRPDALASSNDVGPADSNFVAASAAIQPAPDAGMLIVWKYGAYGQGVDFGTNITFKDRLVGRGPYGATRYNAGFAASARYSMEMAPWSQPNGWHCAMFVPPAVGAESASFYALIDGHHYNNTNAVDAWGADGANNNYAVPAAVPIGINQNTTIAELVVFSGLLTRVQMHQLTMRIAFSYGLPHPALASNGSRRAGLNVIALGNSTTAAGWPAALEWETYSDSFSCVGENFGISGGNDDDIRSQVGSVLNLMESWEEFGRSTIAFYHSGHNKGFAPATQEGYLTGPEYAPQQIRSTGRRFVLWSPSAWNESASNEVNRLQLLTWMNATPVTTYNAGTYQTVRKQAFTPNYANINAYVDGFIDIGNTLQWGVWDSGSISGSGNFLSPYVFPAGTSRGDFYQCGAESAADGSEDYPSPYHTGLWSDAVHPTDYGNQSFAQLIKPCTEQAMAYVTASAITGNGCTLTVVGSVAGVTFQWFRTSGGNKNGITLSGTSASIAVTGLTPLNSYEFRCRATGTLPGQTNPRYWWLETAPITITTPVIVATYTDPGIANVRSGTAYTYNNTSQTGTLTLPAASAVLTGTTFDATTAGTATVPTAGLVVSGTSYGAGGNALTGTVVLPAVGNVRSGSGYGAASGTTGTLALPIASNVVTGIQYGAGGTEFTGTHIDVTGTYTDPGIANVRLGTGYTYNNASRTGTLAVPSLANTKIGVAGDGGTGTYDGSDRWTDPGVANVLSTANYKANSTTGNRTGTVALPVAGEVKVGITFGAASGTTGTYDGSDRWTDPGVSNVISGVAYKANSATSNRTGTYVADAGSGTGGLDDEVEPGTGITGKHVLALMAATLAGDVSGAGTGIIVIKGAGSETTRITAVTDSSGNRYNITLNLPDY